MDVRIFSKTIPDGDCLTWKGHLNYAGYGLIWTKDKKYRVHRIIHELFIGPIAEGLCVDHLCRNRACVNPEHLEAVTPVENVRRGVPKNRNKTHCVKGHEFSLENTTILKSGKRRCRKCHNRLNREWKARCKQQSI